MEDGMERQGRWQDRQPPPATLGSRVSASTQREPRGGRALTLTLYTEHDSVVLEKWYNYSNSCPVNIYTRGTMRGGRWVKSERRFSEFYF